MHHPIDNILEDLYTLDPALKEQDAEVRIIVTKFLETRPDVSPDTLFVQNLRARLIHTKTSTFHAINQPVKWWVVHFVPVGVFAILTLMLVPQLLTTPTGVMTLPLSPESSSNSSEFRILEQSAPTEDGFQTFMKTTVVDEPQNNITIPTQTWGTTIIVEIISIEAPGFVVVQKNISGERGEVIGVSPLISPLVSGYIEVPLTVPTIEDGTYFASFLLDGGDGVWGQDYQGDDDVVLSVPFSTYSRAPEF